MLHGASKTPNEISQCFTKNHLWQWLKQDQHFTVCHTGACQNISQTLLPQMWAGAHTGFIPELVHFHFPYWPQIRWEHTQHQSAADSVHLADMKAMCTWAFQKKMMKVCKTWLTHLSLSSKPFHRTKNKPNQDCYLSGFSEQDHPQQSSGKGPSNCTLKYGRCRQQTLHAHGHEDCCPGTGRACLPLSHKHGTSWHLAQYANPCQCSFARTV